MSGRIECVSGAQVLASFAPLRGFFVSRKGAKQQSSNRSIRYLVAGLPRWALRPCVVRKSRQENKFSRLCILGITAATGLKILRIFLTLARFRPKDSFEELATAKTAANASSNSKWQTGRKAGTQSYGSATPATPVASADRQAAEIATVVGGCCFRA
jgi:hypothetical protein